MVDAFHQALAHGGKDNGAPGYRPYHPGYYGAFVLDGRQQYRGGLPWRSPPQRALGQGDVLNDGAAPAVRATSGPAP